MPLKTTTGPEIGIYATNFRRPVQTMKAKGLENDVSCNAAIFTDAHDTKSDIFQTTPTFQAVSRWTWVERHIRQCYNLQESLCRTIHASWHGVR